MSMSIAAAIIIAIPIGPVLRAVFSQEGRAEKVARTVEVPAGH